MMLENYSNLVSLGYQVAKADALFWLDQGKPWILEEEIQSQVCPDFHSLPSFTSSSLLGPCCEHLPLLLHDQVD